MIVSISAGQLSRLAMAMPLREPPPRVRGDDATNLMFRRAAGE
jgi:hypothetical protein